LRGSTNELVTGKAAIPDFDAVPIQEPFDIDTTPG
jgi:hypothetical protein